MIQGRKSTMAQIKVRDLDDWVVHILRDNALSAGHSLEQHLRELLKTAALADQKRFAEEQLRHLAEFKEKHGELTDSSAGIRADRELNG
jgi:plasmid stability protein